MDVHLVDGTYELFRQYFGQPSRQSADGIEIAATRGVLSTVLSMIDDGASHIGVATDHVIESFRNSMWPGYKTSEGVPADLLAQFPILESCLQALDVALWPMTDLEADDALASAAAVAAEDERVGQIRIYTPDKDLAQCVRDRRVVQVDRRSGQLIDDQAVRAKFGVNPASIPDWLALTGDSADGFPGLKGWGRKSAALVLARYETLERIPDDAEVWDPDLRRAVRSSANLARTLASQRELAELFRSLATLRIEPHVIESVAELEWHGPREEFASVCELVGDPRLLARATALARRN